MLHRLEYKSSDYEALAPCDVFMDIFVSVFTGLDRVVHCYIGDVGLVGLFADAVNLDCKVHQKLLSHGILGKKGLTKSTLYFNYNIDYKM